MTDTAPDVSLPAPDAAARGDQPASEAALVETAQHAVSRCNWVVGECAADWTQRYARGRTDADFAALVGLSADQVYQRRRVWETFADVRDRYAAPGPGGKGLRWSHFYVALTWDDAPECLDWARENEATVAEMKAFRRALHGEDLSEPAARGPADDFAGDPSVIRLPTTPVPVRDPGAGSASDGAADEAPPWDEDGAGASRPDRGEPALAAHRETSGGDGGEGGDADGYAPFGAGAKGPAPTGDGAEDDEDRTDANAARVTKTLERLDATLTEAVLDSFETLPDSRKTHLSDAARTVLGKIQVLTSLG